MPSKRAAFCLHVRVDNKPGVVRRQAWDELGDNVLGDFAGRIANQVVPVDEVAQGIAAAIVENLPVALAEKGIQASAELAFQQSSLIAILVEVRAADFQRMAEHGVVSRPTAQLIQCFEFLPALVRRPLLASVLRSVAEGLIPEVPREVRSDLARRGGVEARVDAVPMEAAADALFEALAALRQEELERRRQQAFQKAARDLTGKEEPTLSEVTRALARRADADLKTAAKLVRELLTPLECDEPRPRRVVKNA